MYNSDNQNFKNEVSKRFYLHFYEKVRSKEINREQFFANMNVGISAVHCMQFFSQLKSGHKSVTMDHIAAAWEHYQVSPNFLFGVGTDPVTMAADPDVVYKKDLKRELAKMRKALDELEKKIDNK